MADKKIGAVLVIGGGIGGIQAALDLAENGYKVYLLDNKSAIGGMMAQLDKTFPTNDCSMCIMAPKLVECGRHRNIELITNAELLKVTGEAGDFRVTIKKKPRYVDLSKCTGCGECVEVCPVEVPNEFDLGLANRKAIYRLYPQAVPNAFAIDKQGISPCRDACPAGINVQGYVALISQGKFKEAIELIRERMPFPAICGRVCHHPCEDKCNRNEIDDPIAIRALKRFVADWALRHEEEPERIEPVYKDKKVAIIGAGPAGLTCAFDLLKMGYPVTVFEANDKPGGMMTMCIPYYRLPKEITEKEINWVLKHGIELKTGVKVGRDITLEEIFAQGYKAIFIAIGAQNPKKLRLEGTELDGVLYGIPFLKSVKSGTSVNIGKKVIIIGGGNVAIDCAKSAVRLGAEEVHLVCLETRDLSSKDRMPAHDWEIEEAEEEGVIIHPCRGPKRIIGENGKVKGLETLHCSSVFDEAGKFNPKLEPGTEEVIEGDTVIIAIGQEPDLSGFEKLDITPWKTIKVDEVTLETNIRGVFAGGDIVSGPASIVEAVGHGHEAAISIDRYLQGKDLKADRKKEVKVAELPERKIEKAKRIEPRKRPADVRKNDWDEIELGYESEELAIQEAKRCINCATCSECLQCMNKCEAEAILHEMVEEEVTIEVGAIILALGGEIFSPEIKDEYGYGRYPNVVTSLQFERMLSASGPYEGHLVRPADNKPPRKVAWIQCVGSRETHKGGKPYCSAVCCMYATKQAMIAKEHDKNIEPTIFFMDMRAYGKDFDKYYERAKKEYNVRYIRARVASIKEIPENHNLLIKYEDEEGNLIEEEFDLVVLSVGFTPGREVVELSKKIGINLNEYGFCETDEFHPVQTSRPGIYVCGVFEAPKDIPETVTQASGAAACAASLLSNVRGSLVTEKVYPEERDVTGEPPRVGVFVCRCGINIGAYVDVPEVVEYAKTLPNVVYAEENLFTCSQDTQQRIKEKIKEYKLNRVVVASCTPRTHEPLFQETLREAGLNPYLFEMANIRDQCSWVHMNEPEEATRKAKELVRMAVAKACLLEPITPVEVNITPSALVIGGGLAGMVSALNIADQGYEVYLVEREKELGGNLRNLYYTLEGGDVQKLLRELIEKVETHDKIRVYKNAKIKSIEGYIGNYKTQIEVDSSIIELEHGVIIVATGAKESKPKEYLYGEDKRVITQREFEKYLAENGHSIDKYNTIVMIQCVNSREEEHPYCSRVCCREAIKNALKAKELNPNVEIFILYRDIRTYGFSELAYQRAREKGIVFIRYDLDKKPVVKKNGNSLEVKVYDRVIKDEVLIEPDLIVLSPAIVANDGNEELAKLLKVPLNQEQFFLEAHVKLRPVDFATEGIFLCGMAHSPKTIKETISQAYAASARACTILSKPKYRGEPRIVSIDEKICSGCGICVSVCPYDALEIVVKDGKRVSQVIPALCKGCGSCASACPSGAAQQLGFKKEQLRAAIEAALT